MGSGARGPRRRLVFTRLAAVSIICCVSPIISHSPILGLAYLIRRDNIGLFDAISMAYPLEPISLCTPSCVIGGVRGPRRRLV